MSITRGGHPAYDTDPEPGSAEDELAERVEAAVWQVFRTATTAQVAKVTRGVRDAAVAYAEAWQQGAPRRIANVQPGDEDTIDDLEAQLAEQLGLDEKIRQAIS